MSRNRKNRAATPVPAVLPAKRVTELPPMRRPLLWVVLSMAVVVSLLCLPVFRGEMLATQMSDAWTGYAFREYALDFMRTFHSVPSWNPYIFGGMPYVGSIAGDLFYPTAILRLVFGTATGFSLGLMANLVVAGVGMFLFASRLGVGVYPAWISGFAYMLSGQVFSLLSPGHDGKLFVSALLPFVFLAIFKAVSTGSWKWYLGVGALMGFSLLTPHFQMTYYMILGSIAWWAWLMFASPFRATGHTVLRSLAFLVPAAVLALGIAAVQVLPFVEYAPFSPRGAAGSSSTGWEYASSWSMPPVETIGVFWAGFSGWFQNYWGDNPFKLHGEYAGVVALVLAMFSFSPLRRRTALFFIILAGFATLFAWGGHTPFYYIPYYLFPGLSKTRAVSMMFFLSAFSIAVLAGFGAERIFASSAADRRRMGLRILKFGPALALVALIAASPLITGFGTARPAAAIAAVTPARLDAFRIALFLAALGVSVSFVRRPGVLVSLVIGLLVADLASVQWRFANTTPSSVFDADGVVTELGKDSLNSLSWRVLPMAGYTDTYLMAHGIRSVLGYHGQELHRMDQLFGGKNEWRAITTPQVLSAMAVRYVILKDSVADPSLVPVSRSVTYEGDTVRLYRLSNPGPFARIARMAASVPTDSLALAAFSTASFDPFAAVVTGSGVFATYTSPPPAVEAVPSGVSSWTLKPLGPVLDRSVLVVSEPWTPFWKATVDGRSVPVERAQSALVGIVLPSGAKEVRLEFHDPALSLGAKVTLLSLSLLALLLATAFVSRARPPAVEPA